MYKRDENEIAHGILLQATLTTPRAGEAPMQRFRRLGGYLAGTLRAERFTKAELSEQGRKGAAKRRKAGNL